ncbi:MAG: TetR/AcrR family transcriptional regulator [Balneolales bacterium]
MAVQLIKKQDLRRSILDTSRHMLVSEGFNHLSMRKIAREAGCSATSIYLYFRNKDALLHALIDEGFEMIFSLIKGKISEDNRPAVNLEVLCRTFIKFGLDNPEYYEIMFLLHPKNMDRYPAENFRRATRPVSILADTLLQGEKTGYFTIQDPVVEAHVIWSSLHGAITAILANRIDVRINQQDFIDSVVQHVIRGLTRGREKNGC